MSTSAGPDDRSPPRRLAGWAGWWRAARNLGLLGQRSRPGPTLDIVEAGDGQSIPVHVQGQGPPVLLVHGLGCSHRHWLPVARRLARCHRVHAWDARGHGLCRPVAAPVTLGRLAQDLADLSEHFRLEPAVLVGHSMGALTIMQYLHDHGTARVAGVVLVDQSPRVVTDDRWRLGLFGGCSAEQLHRLIDGARRDPAEAVMQQVQAASPGWWRRRLAADAWAGQALRHWLRGHDVAPLLDLADSLVAADFRESLRRLDAPLMVVLGGRSPHYAEVPLDAWYRRTVPHCEVHRYAQAGHSPHCTEPDRFARDVLRFVQDHA